MPCINLSSEVLDKPHLIVLLTRQMPNTVIVTGLSHLDAFVNDVKMVGNNENSSGQDKVQNRMKRFISC